MKPIIRKAAKSDKSSIFELANQLHERVTVDEKVFDMHFESIIADEKHILMVAERDDEVVGYFSANMHYAIYANGKVMYLDEIVVMDSARGQKIGNLLMEELETFAIEQNCILISLATAGASDFYNKLGFQTKAGYYKKYLN
ncbi:GNAT family N-acetyltransferase [Aureibacter tunicatorum]|uniref:Ribosomal protein S18 acetylase RimI-like enzyme n=1 Tax=Aureibacter tunicatorum TaxID=866807 RepID=A0AAE3XQE5_9BACT|nr:GNAT family N-acetyltransferase [Aureibacter tunicatorum]MDR6240016.1 ribosomal protein S18 acetylase RimI-like enzyme [Aureibacter tunicatorum]BDD04488.1 N-acetyltransferase [Aureibacter tunicatorum]